MPKLHNPQLVPQQKQKAELTKRLKWPWSSSKSVAGRKSSRLRPTSSRHRHSSNMFSMPQKPVLQPPTISSNKSKTKMPFFAQASMSLSVRLKPNKLKLKPNEQR